MPTLQGDALTCGALVEYRAFQWGCGMFEYYILQSASSLDALIQELRGVVL